MAKLCPRGKAAAKRKFKVYPSAYANMYASAVCSGKVTPGGKKKNRKKAMGGGMIRSMYGSGGSACAQIKDLEKLDVQVRDNGRKGLRAWVKENWVDMRTSEKMAHTQSVGEVVEKKEKIIQNACPLQKQDG